jgi:hypothetical protein
MTCGFEVGAKERVCCWEDADEGEENGSNGHGSILSWIDMMCGCVCSTVSMFCVLGWIFS